MTVIFQISAYSFEAPYLTPCTYGRLIHAKKFTQIGVRCRPCRAKSLKSNFCSTLDGVQNQSATVLVKLIELVRVVFALT